MATAAVRFEMTNDVILLLPDWLDILMKKNKLGFACITDKLGT